MAEQQTAEAANETAPARKSTSPLLGKLLIVGFMLGVVGVECAVAFFLIPSPEQVAALAEKKMADRLPATLNPTGGGEGDDARSTVEVDLGEYSVTVAQPHASTSLRVDFTLVGTVLEEDEEEVKELYDRKVNRFRDQILYEIRNSEPADLADPQLGLIKRRILEKSTALFGEPLLKSILIPSFSYVEQ